MSADRKPLPVGTEIEYCDHRAVVVRDTGGASLEVECEGARYNWYWKFQGTECRVTKEVTE